MGRPRTLWLPLVLLAVAACREPGASRAKDPQHAALALFELAGLPHEPDDSQLDRLLTSRPDASRRAALRDALALLGRAAPAEVVGAAPLPDPDRAVVDVAAALPGGGTAYYSVQCRRADDGSWRVAGFHGPGVEWPRPGASKGDGLSSLPPAE